MTTPVTTPSTHPTRPAPPAATPAPPPQWAVVVLGVLVAAGLAVAVGVVAGPVLVLALALGVGLGVALFHSRFGFTSAWRQLVAVGQGAALRAHMLMLAAAAALFAVILSSGLGLGGDPQPQLGPIGVALFVGAFLFGVGMQIGGSCASGTLFNVGSGQLAIVYTLVGFVGGSVLATTTWSFWTETLSRGPVVDLAALFGHAGALALSLAAMAAIVGATYLLGRRRTPPAIEAPPSDQGVRRVLRGSWPLWVGALVLAGLNAATLVVTGSPWGITSAFALWGARALEAVGADPATWTYWSSPTNAAQLARPVLADRTSVMDFGIMAGALVAAGLGGVFRLHRHLPLRTIVGAVIGGVLMGYGARIAGGCNIGAYFSGIASFSLHGWLWGLTALVGTVAGLALRPLFRLPVPKPGDARC